MKGIRVKKSDWGATPTGEIPIFDSETIELSKWTSIEIEGKEVILAGPKGATLKRIKDSKKLKCVNGGAYIFIDNFK